jgi:hypothetical protein
MLPSERAGLVMIRRRFLRSNTKIILLIMSGVGVSIIAFSNSEASICPFVAGVSLAINMALANEACVTVATLDLRLAKTALRPPSLALALRCVSLLVGRTRRRPSASILLPLKDICDDMCRVCPSVAVHRSSIPMCGPWRAVLLT